MKRPILAPSLRHLALAVGAFLVLLPFATALSVAMRSPEQIFSFSGSWLPNDLSALRNIEVALHASPLLRFVANGLGLCAIILACQLVTMIPCSYALAKLDFPLKRKLFVLILLSLIVPPQVLAIPHFLMVIKAGAIDSFAGLAFPWVISAFGIFLLRQVFLRIPTDVIDAARLDGMSEWEILARLMVPISAPSLGAFSIYSLVHHWNDLFWPSIIVKSQEMATPPYGVLLFQSDDVGSDLGAMMAGTVLVSLPMILAFVMARRRFLEAMTLRMKS